MFVLGNCAFISGPTSFKTLSCACISLWTVWPCLDSICSYSFRQSLTHSIPPGNQVLLYIYIYIYIWGHTGLRLLASCVFLPCLSRQPVLNPTQSGCPTVGFQLHLLTSLPIYCLTTIRVLIAAHQNRKKAPGTKEKSVVYVLLVLTPQVQCWLAIFSDDDEYALCNSVVCTNTFSHVLPAFIRADHGYGFTCGVFKTGTAGTGTVLHSGTPQHTAYPYCGIAGIDG